MAYGDPIARYDPFPINGPFGISLNLLNQSVLNAEGVWVPAGCMAAGTLELTGSMSTVGVDVYGSNAPGAPLNSYVLTIAGSATAADVVSLTFTSPLLPGGEVASYTVAGGNTATVIATALVASIASKARLKALGVTASNLAGVITVNYPSVPLSDPTNGTTFYNTSTSPGPANTIGVTSGVSGSATETVALAGVVAGSTKIGTTLAALGLTALTPLPFKWIRARIITLTGGGANITANVYGHS